MKFTKLYCFVISYNFVNKYFSTFSLSINSVNSFRSLTLLNLNLTKFNRSLYYSYILTNTNTKMTESCPFSEKSPFDVKPHYVGEEGTKSFAVEFYDSKNNKISPWHGLPLFPYKDYVTMVVEIPRNTRPKMEIKTDLSHNPIKQDLFSSGDLRNLDCPMYWNYGAIPQTWEAPVPYVHKYTNDKGEEVTLELVGDNDPLDILDVGKKTHKVGDLLVMKPVGALALIDQDEIDWKIFAVSPHDEHFHDINDLEDIDRYYPGTTTGVMEYFRWYKTPRGKQLNTFLPKRTFVNKKEALELVHGTHKYYKELMEGKLKNDELWIK